MSIVVIGSCNTDLVIKSPRIPKPGETILGDDRYVLLNGGKGANQAVAAARLGADVSFVGKVGRDFFGDAAQSSLLNEGIGAEFLSVSDEMPTGLAQIVVAMDGENSIVVAPGANSLLSAEDVLEAESVFERADLAMLQFEVPESTIRQAMTLARKHQCKVILNPAPAKYAVDDWLCFVDVITPNETEAEILTGIEIAGEGDARKAAAILRAKGAGAVVVTMGARGAYVSAATFEGMVGGNRALVVDTTAAGDAFNGALAVAISEGRSIRDAVRFANAAAALSVEKLGAQISMPRREEVDSIVISGRF